MKKLRQIGGGFYKSAKIKPVTHFYCYMNIPDTSGRDSLFQAEARQCKNILEKILKLYLAISTCLPTSYILGSIM